MLPEPSTETLREWKQPRQGQETTGNPKGLHHSLRSGSPLPRGGTASASAAEITKNGV